jgi:hypothetical protein
MVKRIKLFTEQGHEHRRVCMIGWPEWLGRGSTSQSPLDRLITAPSRARRSPLRLSSPETQRSDRERSNPQRNRGSTRARRQTKKISLRVRGRTHAPAAGRCWISLALLTPALPDDTSIVCNSHKKRRPLARARPPAYTDTPRMAMARERERESRGGIIESRSAHVPGPSVRHHLSIPPPSFLPAFSTIRAKILCELWKARASLSGRAWSPRQ